MRLCIFCLLLAMMPAANCSAQSTKSATKKTVAAAQIDTVLCNPQNIVKFVEVPNASGTNTRTYAVYEDKQNDISEIIPVSKSVIQYIDLCKENGIKPNLGIKLKNGQIMSLIKLKVRYGKR